MLSPNAAAARCRQALAALNQKQTAGDGLGGAVPGGTGLSTVFPALYQIKPQELAPGIPPLSSPTRSCKAGGSYGLRASFYSQQSCKAEAAQQRSPPQSWPDMSSVGEGEVLRVTAQRPAPHAGPGDEPQRRQKKTHLFYWGVIKLTTRRSREAPGSIERALAAQAASPAAAPGPSRLHPTAVGDRQRFQSWQGTAAPATWATRAFLLPAVAPLLPNPPTVPARKGKGFKCRRRCSSPAEAQATPAWLSSRRFPGNTCRFTAAKKNKK